MSVSLEIWFSSALKPLLVFVFVFHWTFFDRCVFFFHWFRCCDCTSKEIYSLLLKKKKKQQQHQTSNKTIETCSAHEELCSWNVFNCSTENEQIMLYENYIPNILTDCWHIRHKFRRWRIIIIRNQLGAQM